MRDSDNFDFIFFVKSIPDLDVEYAVETVGSSALYEKTLRKTICLLPTHIEQMDRHIEEPTELGLFAVKAHGVKGLLTQIGYPKLAKLAESLEKAAKAGERPECIGQYSLFREELLSFYNLLSAAASHDSEPAAPGDNISGIDKKDLFHALLQAKQAAAEYDILLASEILMPLVNCHFGASVDARLAKIMEALDLFKPRQALDYIEELLKEEKP